MNKGKCWSAFTILNIKKLRKLSDVFRLNYVCTMYGWNEFFAQVLKYWGIKKNFIN